MEAASRKRGKLVTKGGRQGDRGVEGCIMLCQTNGTAVTSGEHPTPIHKSMYQMQNGIRHYASCKNISNCNTSKPSGGRTDSEFRPRYVAPPLSRVHYSSNLYVSNTYLFWYKSVHTRYFHDMTEYKRVPGYCRLYTKASGLRPAVPVMPWHTYLLSCPCMKSRQ